MAVFLSRPRKESKISTEGFAASSARISESYKAVSFQSLHDQSRTGGSLTLSRLPTNLAYSSRTSCSSGLSSGSFSLACRLESIDTSMADASLREVAANRKLLFSSCWSVKCKRVSEVFRERASHATNVHLPLATVRTLIVAFDEARP